MWRVLKTLVIMEDLILLPSARLRVQGLETESLQDLVPLLKIMHNACRSGAVGGCTAAPLILHSPPTTTQSCSPPLLGTENDAGRAVASCEGMLVG